MSQSPQAKAARVLLDLFGFEGAVLRTSDFDKDLVKSIAREYAALQKLRDNLECAEIDAQKKQWAEKNDRMCKGWVAYRRELRRLSE